MYFRKKSAKNSPSFLLAKEKTLKNPESMAEVFNDFFTSIGNNLQK